MLQAQNVNVAGALVGNGSYATLTAAFAAINGGAQTGANIQVTIVNSTNEGTATAVLNAGAWATLSVQPSGGAWTVTGATTAGAPLLDLNGADNVTIDGLNSSGNALTIQNTTVSATSGTSTIRFQADATNNVITRCAIQGSATMAVGTNGGNIWFGAAAVATGNDNNVISFCDIGPAGANIPSKAIYGNGTTTSTTTYNSGNQVLNCNIFDFFGPAVQSAGIYLGQANTGWTISNNRLYQTATRTQTTGSIHAGIQFASTTGNDGHLVSGNTIGFSSSAGTGTYTFVGTSASSRFYPIYSSGAGTLAPSSYQGNLITNISVSGPISGTSTSCPFAAILISSGLANIGNVAGNVIGSVTTPGAISVSSSSVSSADVYGIYFFPSQNANIANNTIAGVTGANSSSGLVIVYGIRAFTAAAVVNTIQNNTIGSPASPVLNNSVAPGSRMIGIYSQSGASVVTGNSVGYMGMIAPNVGTGTAASMIGIWAEHTSATTASNISRNTISAFGNNAPAAVQVAGIVYNVNTISGNVVARNNINTLGVSSATATVFGANVIAGNGTFANNMVRLGYDASGAAITAGCNILGINEGAGTNNFYHNSVYVGAPGVTGSNNTFAFNSTVTTNTRNFQDNIFYNARSNSGGTGKHYAIRVGGTAPNPAGLTSNFNLLLADGTGGFTGLFNGVDQLAITDWRTATGQDNNSFAANPNFVLPTGSAATGDLHIANPTPVESNGTPIAAVTDDFDGQTRSGLTPTDIGADADNFTGSLDLAGPNISYTPLGSSCVPTDRVLTATIADATGVPTSGGLVPRIYYRKNAGAYVSAPGTLTSGTGVSGTWDFTISVAALGGVVPGDIVSYYVIAQDVVGPYVTSNPAAGLVATDVNTVTTHPTAPSTYTVAYTLNGTYTVGVSGAFPTLTAAVTAYNTACLTGPVVFALTDLTYPSETFPITIGANPQASATNTLLIHPTQPGTVLTGSNTTAILAMSGADFVTIDGSVGNVPNTLCPLSAASRDLTISNTSTSTAAAVVWLGMTAGNDPVTNATVRNCVIVGNASTTTLIGLGVGGSSIGVGGGPNNQIALVNNDIRACQFGIYSSGPSAANKNQGLVINQNVMTATGTSSIGQGGIFVAFTNNGSVSGNNIANIVNTATSQDPVGINLGYGAINGMGTTATGIADVISNFTIASNNIGVVTSNSTYSASGIDIGPTTTGTTLVYNNTISGVASNGTAGDFCAGIALSGSNTGVVNIYHNTVSMQGTLPGATAGTQTSACFAVTGSTSPTNVTLRNNIFTNTQAGNAGSTTRFVAIGYNFGAPFTGVNSNYNDLVSAGAGPGTYAIGTTVTLVGGTLATTLANWQTATSGDANSINVAPVFVSATDLHTPIASNAGINNFGTPLPAVPNDIDCENRSATTPDMGADEMVDPCTTADGGVASGSTSFCVSGSTTLTASGFSTGPGSTYNWQSSPAGANTWTNTGGTNPASFATGVVTVSTDYRLWVACATNSSVDSSNVVTVTINPNVTPSVSISANPGATICAGTSVTFTATPTNGGSSPGYQWFKNSNPVGTNSTTYTDAGLLNGDLITCVLTSNAPCATPATATSNTVTMTVDPVLVPTISISANPGTTICAGTNVTFTASITNGGSTPAYQWFKNSNPVGTNSATYSDAGLVNGDVITCTLTSNATCAAPATANSNTVTMTVNPLLTPAVSIGANPGTSICAGTSVTFTATPTNGGSTPGYQWFKNSNPVGTNSDTYADGGLVNGDVISCVLTSSEACASPTTATSNSLTISVVTNTVPTASISVSPNDTICTGGSATFTVVASNAGITPGYQWYKNSNPVGTNSTTYTDGGLVTGDMVNCIVTSSDPCALPTTATSNTITMAVGDFAAPTAVCQSVSVTLDGSGNASTTAAAVNNGSTDNCTAPGSLTLGLNTSTFTCANLGGNTVILTVTDGAGNASTCSATVTVTDPIAPTINCPSNVSTTNTVGSCGAAVTYAAPTANDNCSATVTQTAGLASGATFPVGTTTNTFRATDGAGNTATCSFTVTVTDAELPAVTCPSNINATTGSGVCTATVTFTAPVGTDNCPGVTTTQTAGLASGASFPLGTTTNTFRATDAAGNTATCSFTVTVTDGQLPAITCPANASVNAATGLCSAVYSYTAPVGADNCSGVTTTQTAGLASGATFPVGTTTNTFRATDGAGNTATCSFTVTVTDAELPVVTCPGNISANTGTGVCDAVVTYSVPVGTDNCTGVTTTQTAGLASGATFAVGTTTNTFRATDAAGNIATCSFTVTVTDVELPVITCPSNVSVNADAGLCTATVTYATPSGTDNCSATTSQSAGLASGATFPVGVTTNTFVATDLSSNTATCSFTVTVVDAEAPALTCPANMVVATAPGSCDAVVTYVAPSGTDNCGGATTTQSAGLASGATFPAGTTTNTFVATDLAGNTATCSFTVTVNDSTAPAAACQNITVTLDVSGNASITASDVDNGSADACGSVTLGVNTTAFTCANAGANTVVLTVTDPSGNTSTCSAVVTVQAQAVTSTATATTMSCGYHVSCNGATDGTATASGSGGCPSYTFLWSNGQTTATATGLGAGTYTVTVTDGAGGTSTSTVTLTEPAAVTATLAGSTNACPGEANGSADITPAGGNDCQGYTFLWSNGATSEDLTNVAAGAYTVTVTDVNGCVGTLSVTVGAFAASNPTFSVSGNLLSANQAWPSYQWLLNGSAISGATASTYTITQTGDYSLSVLDTNGCTATSAPINVTYVGTADPATDLLGLSIYPNPARGAFKLQAAEPILQSLTISVYDMHGRRYIQEKVSSLGSELAFDIHAFSAGPYMVEVLAKNGQRMQFKLVVQ